MTLSRRPILIWTTFALLAAAMWFSLPWVAHQLATAILEAKAPAVGRETPDFALKDASGATVHLSQFKGKVVLLNFWATWCGPCKTETPWFVEFQDKWKSQGFTVLGVSMDDDGWPVINPWLREQKVNYPVLLGTPEAAGLYGGVEALPATFVIGRDGKFAAIHTGLIPKANYEKEIEQLLRR